MVNIDKIKALAKQRGLKLGKLCEELGEDQNYFNKVKLGLRRMDDNRIFYLADRLNTTFAYLTDTSDSPYPTVSKTGYFSYQRYNERRIAKGMTPNYVEEHIGVPHGFMDMPNGPGGDLTEAQIAKMAILFGTTPEYLTGCTDDPRISTDDRTGIKIKVFGEVAAGIPLQQIDNFDPDDADSWEEIDRNTAKNGSYFALRIKGNSMEPRIYNGDVVIVREQSTVDSGDIAVVAVNGDTATCKKVVWDAGGGMFLIALNSAYPPMYFSADEIQTKPVTILGKVVELRGKL